MYLNSHPQHHKQYSAITVVAMPTAKQVIVVFYACFIQHTMESSAVTEISLSRTPTAVAYFILGKRLGCLETGQITPDYKAFIDAVNRLFTSTFDLVFSVPFYLLWESKVWEEAVDSMTSVNNLAMKFINERMQEIMEEEKRALEDSKEVPGEVDFLTYLVHSEKLSPEELSTNTVDLLLAAWSRNSELTTIGLVIV